MPEQFDFHPNLRLCLWHFRCKAIQDTPHNSRNSKTSANMNAFTRSKTNQRDSKTCKQTNKRHKYKKNNQKLNKNKNIQQTNKTFKKTRSEIKKSKNNKTSSQT
jgi:hypothetical protein